MMVTVNRKSHFNAAHKLHNPKWTEEKNQQFFGKCSNPNYHGHNYEIIVAVKGEIDPETGYVVDMKWLKKIILENIELRFDHKNLNVEVDEFKSLNPTAENICVVIYNILRPLVSKDFLLGITLYETPRNFVEYGDL